MGKGETPHADDVDLILRVRRADSEAIERFVVRMGCVPRMVSQQNFRFGSPLDSGEVEDLVQDVLMVIWKKLEQFEGRSALETWVYRICRLELMNGIRRKRRQPAPTEHIDPQAPESQMSGLDAEDALRGLATIGPPFSDVIRLKHFEQLTFEEIASRFDVSPNTAKTHYYRGLSRLRDILSPKAAKGRGKM